MGIEWAIDNGMHVVNMSFGAVVPVPSMAEEAAMNAAYQRGIVLVAASGNSSTPAVGYPASYESVIAVGATDEEDQLATFSQWGTAQELTAPGVSNLSAVPVGFGQTTDLTVDSDGGRALDAIAMEFAGLTPKKGIRAQTIYASLGTPLDFAGIDCTGRIALMTRGGTSFAEKATEAKNAGCAAAIIHNNQPGNFNGTLGAEGDWIPVVSLSLDEGLYLKDQIDSGPTIVTLLNVQGDYAFFSGTSMASPHAAGVAALVLQRNPGASPDLVRQILRESSEDLGLGGWDPMFGYGRVNARRGVTR
jgi:subtilisin family serine protease